LLRGSEKIQLDRKWLLHAESGSDPASGAACMERGGKVRADIASMPALEHSLTGATGGAHALPEFAFFITAPF